MRSGPSKLDHGVLVTGTLIPVLFTKPCLLLVSGIATASGTVVYLRVGGVSSITLDLPVCVAALVVQASHVLA